jgi:hypothetical protein
MNYFCHLLTYISNKSDNHILVIGIVISIIRQLDSIDYDIYTYG